MRVLLTGATGFIGASVRSLLLRQGHQVRALALPGTERSLAPGRGLEVVVGSLNDRERLDDAARGVDVVYHLAGLLPGNPPEELVRTNVLGTKNLLESCARHRVMRIVFSSSTSVYAAASLPYAVGITETSELRSSAAYGLDYYALTKIAAERLIARCHRDCRLQYAILRAPVAYGSQDGWDRQLLDRLRAQPWLALSRVAAVPNIQWVHVEDLAHGILLGGTHPNAANEVFNIAGGELLSLRDIAAVVCDLPGGGWRYPLLRNRDVAGAAGGLKYDISKSRVLIGYLPRARLERLRRDGQLS